MFDKNVDNFLILIFPRNYLKYIILIYINYELL